MSTNAKKNNQEGIVFNSCFNSHVGYTSTIFQQTVSINGNSHTQNQSLGVLWESLNSSALSAVFKANQKITEYTTITSLTSGLQAFQR